MQTTQDYIPIKDIHDDVVILKDGSMSVVLETTAVNFGLLSENEQLAIISAFAALLNSLSFSIQIVIRSKRLDISSYLKLLANAQSKQKNTLLAKLMSDYRNFIETIVRENQVLDKKFYIIISVSPFEVGLTGFTKDRFEKALTVLLPRRDHISRQLWRTGLKATQLTSKQLINLYFDVYNPPYIATPPHAEEPVNIQAAPQKEVVTAPQAPVQTPPPSAPLQPVQPKPQSPVQPQPPAVNTKPPPPVQAPPLQKRPLSISTPFVVEELQDEYGTA